MRILACHNYYRLRGGEDQSFEDEVAMLKRHGHDVAVYTDHNDRVDDLSRATLARRTLANPASAAAVRLLIERERPDVLHCTNTFPLLSPSIYGAARDAGVAVVQSLRNYRLICPAATLFRDGRVCQDCVGSAVAWPAIRHRCYRGSVGASITVAAFLAWHRHRGTWTHDVDMFYTLSEFARAKLVEGGVPAASLRVKPNFVDPDPLRDSGGVVAPTRSSDIAFVARLSPEKGVRWLLDAFRLIAPPARLIVVGEGPLEGLVRERAAENSRIEWRGRLPIGDAIRVMGRAAVSVCSSEWYEPFGRTVIESFAVGTPVIATNHGATAELVDHEQTGLLVEPGDVRGLAESITRVLGDADLQGRLSRNARTTYESTYTASANYEMLMRIYREALNAADRNPRLIGATE